MKNVLFILVVSAFLAAVSAGQSFNIDVGGITPGGAGAGTPAPLFAGAANRPGMWNAISGLGPGPFSLVDLEAHPTAVICTRDAGGNPFFGYNNSMTTGYFQALMDDGHSGGPGETRTYVFTGLTPGTYTVYTYAWSPLTATDLTNVAVPGSSSPNPQAIGGTLPATNTFAQGITHAIHVINLAPGAALTIVCTVASGYSTVNGFQIGKGYGFSMGQAIAGGMLFVGNAGGAPGGAYVNLVTATQGAFPNGSLFGIEMTIGEALGLISLGPPFFGTLNGSGTASYLVPGPLPSGVTIYCVGLELTPALTGIVAIRDAFSYTFL